MTVEEQAKANFDREIQKNLPGFAYDVDLIDDIGSGFPCTGNSYRTRCEYYKRDKDTRKIFRTSTDDPLCRGTILFFPDLCGDLNRVSSDGFAMIIDEPDQQPDCNKAYPVRCNALLSICKDLPEAVDQYGYSSVEAGGGVKTLIKDIPVVVDHSQSIQAGTGFPGLTVDDQLIVTLQRNKFTAQIDHGCWFRLDHTKYKVLDAIADVHGGSGGILRLMCRRVSGSYQT